MSIQSKITKPFVSILLPLVALSCIFLYACQEPEPEDPRYALNAPTLLSAEPVSDTEIQLMWKNSEQHAEEIAILRKSIGLAWKTIAIVPIAETVYIDSSLDLGTLYTYSLQSKVEINYSELSNEIQAIPGFSSPTNFQAIVLTDTTIRFSWDDIYSFEKGFVIERNEEVLSTLPADSTEIVDSGLIFGQYYSYRVAAFTDSNQTNWSTIDSVTTIFPGPSDLVITPQNDEAVSIVWADNSDFESGFRLERDNGGGFLQIALLDPNETEFLDSGLEAGTDYLYRVAAFTHLNQSEWLTSNPITTMDVLAPINLVAVANQDSRIVLSWSDLNLIELGFIVERDEGQGDGFTPLVVLPSSETSLVDTGLIYGINYEYRVAAYTNQNTSDWVKSGRVTTDLPGPSELIVTSINDGAMQLEWRDNCSFESGYRIEQNEGNGYIELIVLLPDAQGYLVEGLTMDVSYSYRIAAFTATNTSEWLVSANEQTSFPPPTTLNTYPLNDSDISIEWVDNSTFELGFFIERNDGSGYVRVDTGDANQTTFLDTGLIFGSTYRYRVAAFTNSNISQYAIGLSTNTIFPEPSSLTAFPLSESKIRLQWEDNCNFELGFIVQRNDGTGFIAIDTLSENITEYLDEDLVEGSYYSYRIAAFTAGNRSAWVNSGVVQTDVFPRPTSLTAIAIDDANIELVWVDYNDQEIGFIIERDIGDGNGFSEITQVVTATTQYIDSGLLFGPTYSYRISSFSESRQSPWTLSIPIQTFFPAPSNLIGEAVNDTTVILSWLDNCNFERNYIIEVDDGNGYVQADSLSANRTASSIHNLNYGTSYTFRVAAQTQFNTSNYSTTNVLQTLSLDAPSGVDIEALSDAEIWISWEDNSNFETGYRIERNTDAAGFVPLVDILAGAEQYIDSNLVYGTDYSYRIASFTPNNQSSWGQSGVVSTIAPQEPSGFVGIPLSDTEVGVHWVDNSSFEDGFHIQRDAGAGWVDITDATANATTYRDSGLAYGETYNYRIAAFTTQVQSSWVTSDPVETIYPQIPTDLRVVALSDHELRITWDDNCSFETGFLIEKDNGTGFVPLISLGNDVEEYIDSGLQYGEFYYRYRIATFTNANTTNWITSTYVNTVFPSPSFLSTSSVSDTELLLTWVDNSSFETGFQIERDDGAGFSLITTTVADVTRYTDSNLDHNETYIYRVAAISDYNTSGWVTSASSSTVFLAPTFLNALVTDDASITLSWDDNYSFESGYILQRSDNGGAYATINSPGAGVTEYTDTGLTYGIDYQYRVAAYTADNTSTYVTSSVVTTILNQPTQFSAISLSDASLKLGWVDNCSFEDGYKLERDSGAGYVEIADLAANTRFYINTGLTYGAEYHYRLIIYTDDNFGDPVYLNSVGTVFPSPTFLTASAIDDITISLSWDDNYSFETGYTLQRSDDGGAYTLVASLAAGVTDYTDTGLTYGIDYQYRVAATTATNTSDWVTSSALTTVFVGPSNIAVEAQDDVSIDITWTDNSSSETGFTLQRSDNGGAYATINSPAVNATSYSDAGLSLTTTYIYRVAAKTATNTSAWSTSTSVSTLALDLPTSVTAVAVTDASITISWVDNCDFETGFTLQRSDNGGSYATINSPAADATDYTDTGLTYGVSYQYRIAVNTASNSSDYVTSSALTTVLDQPTNLAATVLSDASLKITWVDNSSIESGYKLERDSGAGYVEIADLAANTRFYINTGLTYGTEYHYRLIIYTAGNTGDPVYLNSVGTTFASPTFLTVSALDDASISLGWDDNYSFETGYTLQRSDDGGAYTLVASLAAGVTDYTDTGLTYGIDYQYRVAATTATNTSDWVTSSALTTVFVGPSNIAVEAQDDVSIDISWTDNSNSETGFTLQRSANGGSYSTITSTLAVNATSYSDNGLSLGVNYRYRVAATTATNISAWSTSSSVSTLALDLPTSVSAVAITDASIAISWVDNCDFETGFTLQRSDNGGAYATIESPVADVTQYTDTGLSYGTDYRYRVATYTGDNTSAFVSSSVVSTFLNQPTQLSATALSDASLKLTWVDNCSFEGGYKLERDSGAGFVEIADLGANVTSYTNTGLTYGTVYHYRLIIYTATNEADPVYLNSVGTTFPSPTFLTASAINDSSITLAWDDNYSFETGFTLQRSDDGAAYATINSPAAGVTNYTDTGLTYGIDYQYRVAATTAANTSDWSTSASVTTIALDLPTSVTAVAVTDASITISWVDNCDFESGYIVEEDDGTGFNEISDQGANSTSYTRTGLTLGTEYTYRVIVYTAANQADPVYTSSLETVFLAPSGFSAIPISNDEVLLSWTDNSSFETGFKIERDEGAGFVALTSPAADAAEYTDTGLSSGTLYKYRIRAYTADNNSAYSTEVLSGSVIVPAGPYTYGEGDTVYTDLDEDFLMMHYEVTNAQYVAYLTAALSDAIITADANTVTGPWDGSGTYQYIDLDDPVAGHITYSAGSFAIDLGYENHPVTEVTWFGADAYADYYTGLRLPTEFEWEKAARSDTGYDYPWGDTTPDCGDSNFLGCVGDTQPVGTATGASPFGILDMAGNVWEWTASFDAVATTERVLRGGSFSNAATTVKTWSSYSNDPANANANVGFRCVIDN